jgi:hypothetical protein
MPRKNSRRSAGRHSAGGRRSAGRRSAGRRSAGRHSAGRRSAGRRSAGRRSAGRFRAADQSSADQSWYYIDQIGDDYNYVGPVSFEYLKKLQHYGYVDSETYIWDRETMDGWQPLSEVENGPGAIKDENMPPTAYGVLVQEVAELKELVTAMRAGGFAQPPLPGGLAPPPLPTGAAAPVPPVPPPPPGGRALPPPGGGARVAGAEVGVGKRAARAPVAAGVGDMMKQRNRQMASKKLVDRKEEVIKFVQQAASLQPATVAEAVTELKSLEDKADELGIPLLGEEWGERLSSIEGKDGSVPYAKAECETAKTAQARLNVLQTAVTWHEQLKRPSTQIASMVKGFRTKGGSGAALSKGEMLEKCTVLLESIRSAIQLVFSDPLFSSTIAKMEGFLFPNEKVESPQTSFSFGKKLETNAAKLRTGTLLLAEFAHEIALKEVDGLRAEKLSAVKRSRAPQTLAVLTSAVRLVQDVSAVARPKEKEKVEVDRYLKEINMKIEQVEEMIQVR